MHEQEISYNSLNGRTHENSPIAINGKGRSISQRCFVYLYVNAKGSEIKENC